MNQHETGGYVPDAYAQKLRISGILSGVFLWMFLGLLASALTAWLTATTEIMRNFVYGTSYGFVSLIVVEFILVLFAVPRIWNMSGFAGGAVFFLFAAVNGMTLSSIFLVYELGSILWVFLCAAGMFGVMAVYGTLTKNDLTGVGSFLIMGLFGIIIAGLVNFLLQSETLDVLISFVAIAVFLGLTAYDVQRIRAMAYESPDDAADRSIMILGALSLYMNFINLFLRILRLLGKRR